MTSLENFLNNQSRQKVTHTFDEVEGSFKCQNLDCDDVVNEAGMDREKGKIFWTCKNGHESGVAI